MNKKLLIVTVVLVLLAVAGLSAWQYYSYSGPIPEPPCPPGMPVVFDGMNERVESIIKRYHVPDKPLDTKDVRGYFSVTGGGPADLYGSADMVYILWITGELERRTTKAGRAEWAAFIQSFQSPGTGYFDRDKNLEESATHATAFAVAALKMLGYKPRYPMKWAENIFGSPESVERWLDSLHWNEVWSGSHEIGAAAAVLDAPDGLNLPPGWKDWLIKGFNKRVDANTGLWKQGLSDKIVHSATTIDLGGAAHFWWMYDHIGVPVPFPEEALISIMGLQKKSGIWGNRLFNGPVPQGIDFDAINGMRLAWRNASPEFRRQNRDRVIAVLDKYACTVNYRLGPPDSFLSLYKKSHKLVGTLNALAELDMFYREITGRGILKTDRPLRCSLEVVSWQ